MTTKAQVAVPAKKSPTKAKKVAAKPATKTKAPTLVVRVGAVTVEMPRPTGIEIQRNIKTGQSALKRAGVVFAKPGVTLPPRADAPLYYADPDHPGRLVREAGGKRAVGQFVNGRFVAVRSGGKARAA
jgi:hypothetical protein